MRFLAALATAFTFASLLVMVTGGASIAAGPNRALAPGDQLVYEIAVELQQHHTTAGPKGIDKAAESSAQGTESFTIYAIGKDGTAFANVDASFKGIDRGKPFESHTTTSAKVLPDGRLRLKNWFGIGISDAISFANTTTAEVARHALRLGSGWTTTHVTPYIRLTLVRKVAGMKAYQGYSAYEVQSSGSGQLIMTTDGAAANGTVAISGTSYYDAADHLFIGEALRTLTVIQPSGSAAAHDNYSATMQVVLSSWTRGSPAPAPPAPEQSAPQASTPAPQYASPEPIPSIYGSTPVPTVTPRLGP